MRRIVILGIGSRIMKDDGVAVKAAEYLKDRISGNDIEIIVGETDVAYCANRIRNTDYLVILDAMVSGKEPGAITVLPLDIAVECWRKPYSQHEMSLFDEITLKLPKVDGCLIGIEVAEVEFGLELSDELDYKFTVICSQIESIIEKIRGS